MMRFAFTIAVAALVLSAPAAYAERTVTLNEFLSLCDQGDPNCMLEIDEYLQEDASDGLSCPPASMSNEDADRELLNRLRQVAATNASAANSSWDDAMTTTLLNFYPCNH